MNQPTTNEQAKGEGMKAKLFKATTTIDGSREPFVDWFKAESLGEAKAKCDGDAKEYGLPMDERRSVVYVECNPETLKPL
jgi:hypothetical protein